MIEKYAHIPPVAYRKIYRKLARTFSRQYWGHEWSDSEIQLDDLWDATTKVADKNGEEKSTSAIKHHFDIDTINYLSKKYRLSEDKKDNVTLFSRVLEKILKYLDFNISIDRSKLTVKYLEQCAVELAYTLEIDGPNEEIQSDITLLQAKNISSHFHSDGSDEAEIVSLVRNFTQAITQQRFNDAWHMLRPVLQQLKGWGEKNVEDFQKNYFNFISIRNVRVFDIELQNDTSANATIYHKDWVYSYPIDGMASICGLTVEKANQLPQFLGEARQHLMRYGGDKDKIKELPLSLFFKKGSEEEIWKACGVSGSHLNDILGRKGTDTIHRLFEGEFEKINGQWFIKSINPVHLFPTI